MTVVEALRVRRPARRNSSLGLFDKNKSWQAAVGAQLLSPSPHQEGVAPQFNDHRLGRPTCGPLFFLVRNVATAPLTNDERFRLFFESEKTQFPPARGMHHLWPTPIADQ
jgi:hypothetical protein